MTSPTYVQEYSAIVGVLNHYIKGCTQANSALMKPAFHEQATMFGVNGDALAGGAIENLFEVIDKDFRPSPEARAVIGRIDIVGTAASARVDTDDVSGFCFTDFFHLLKVAGRWTIVSKIYHTHSAA
ncbi:nuclear transport factor 2 family protein [Pseudomonas sp. SWRI111]|uniref:nuclear transport factor 2 family protein n=1 Tax=Pseudomonas sp. SWRI111 TaxID=2745507 RepID=UPI0016459B4F|nr:nuclear transport factor 2 family protein [Pseudomonas sp. SWRI111]MBC3208908.1 nuclear transport factor 2 family protein [Pseudomonas sp. SWRI111]